MKRSYGRTTVVVDQNFAGLEHAILHDAAAAITMIAEEVMLDSKLNYVPVVNGYLRMSGTVGKPQITGNRVQITMGYGGPTAIGKNVTYALKVHEAPDHIGQGKNKYLTKPLYAIVPRIGHFMATFMGHRLQSRRYL